MVLFLTSIQLLGSLKAIKRYRENRAKEMRVRRLTVYVYKAVILYNKSKRETFFVCSVYTLELKRRKKIH